jgi:ligand-binding sensor domain-containing protein
MNPFHHFSCWLRARSKTEIATIARYRKSFVGRATFSRALNYPAFVGPVLVIPLAVVLWQVAPRHVEAVQPEGSAITGQVQDDQGAPVSDAKVTLTSQDFSTSTLTAQDGKFEFRKLAMGAYKLTAEVTGFRKQSMQMLIGRVGESLTPVIKLNPSSLHVAVFDATTRQPLRGVSVVLSDRERAAGAGGSQSAARIATDEGGDAYFGRLGSGSYQLAASLRGYDEYRSVVFISSGRITTEFALPLSIAPVIPINDKASQRYNVPNLPSKNVQAIFQDSEGWLWLGTDKGIARFNGADFKSSAAPGSPYASLAGTDVRSIAEDQRGVMWLGTSQGVERIAKDGAAAGELLPGNDVRNIMADSRGNVWVATGGGEFRYDSNGIVTTFDQSRGLGSTDVRGAAEDASGKILLATAAGAYSVNGDNTVAVDLGSYLSQAASAGEFSTKPAGSSDRRASGGTVADGQAGGRARASESTGHRELGKLTDVRTVFVDRDGAAWFATADGVVVVSTKKGSPGSGSGVDLSAVPAARTVPTAGGVRSIGQDGMGRLWFALNSGGALIYSPIRRDAQRIGLVERDRVGAILTDREGNVWFGTDDGAVRTDFCSFVDFNTSRGLADNDVWDVVEEPANFAAGERSNPDHLWFLTGAGISIMRNERLVTLEGFRATVAVHSAAFDHEGAAWIGTDEGVFELGGQALTQLNEGNGLASNKVNYVYGAAGGSIIALATAKGLNLYKGGVLSGADPLSGYDVRHLTEAADGKLWCATDRGIVIFDPVTGGADVIDSGRGLIDSDVRAIVRTGSRMIVATRSGIQYYDISSNPEQGGQILPPVTVDKEAASALVVDRDDYLWAGTDDGQVKKFAVYDGQVISTAYSGETTALTNKRINSIYEDSSGTIWIATAGGAVRHIPDRRPPLTQVSAEVDGKPLQYQDATAREAGVFDVPYGARKLTFYFTGVSMDGPVRFLYRLKSAQGDQSWTTLPAQQAAEREVSISEFGQGPHTFEIKAINRDLYGIGASPAAFSLRVGPPFWQKGWFYSLAFILVGLFAATVAAARRIRNREFVLPRELRNYIPIEPNPYIVGNPIRTETMFYGREDDFRYVRTKLDSANQGVVIVFCGERRVGKSSILYQVLNGRLGARFVPVFVDMQEMVIASDAEFFARTSRLIAEAVATADRDGAAIAALSATHGLSSQRRRAEAAPDLRATVPRSAGPKSVPVPSFGGSNPYPVFLDFLDDVLRILGDRTLLILVDEYELMESKVDDGKLSQELFTFLAGLMDNKERLALIFTGSRRLEERDKKYWRELLRRSLFRKVGFLSEKDTVRLVVEPVTGQVVYGKGVAELIYRLTAGQAFYTQVICQNTVDYLNETRRNWVVVADLKHIIDDILDNPLPQMIYAWDGLSDDEKIALSLLAESLPDGSLFATAAQLRGSVDLNDYPVHLSENTIRLTLEEMFRREMLDKDAIDGFKLKMDLFRLWVRRSHSIWQVVNEVRTL